MLRRWSVRGAANRASPWGWKRRKTYSSKLVVPFLACDAHFDRLSILPAETTTPTCRLEKCGTTIDTAAFARAARDAMVAVS